MGILVQSSRNIRKPPCSRDGSLKPEPQQFSFRPPTIRSFSFFLITSVNLSGYSENAIPEAGETDPSLGKDPEIVQICTALSDVNTAAENLAFGLRSPVLCPCGFPLWVFFFFPRLKFYIV